jgi:hypothetical protein
LSHTFVAKGGTRFIYNGDLSGNVTIYAVIGVESRNGREVSVPGLDLLEFVGEFVRDRQIARVESMSAFDVLGLYIPEAYRRDEKQ